MINEHELAESELSIRALAEKHPSAKEWVTREAEIIRNARRYLALRENEAIAGAQAGEVNSISGFYAEFDAAADRLLEGGE